MQEGWRRSRARNSWAAYGAGALAFAYAGVSLYWALGGTAGLDTVGGYAERLAHSGGLAALTVIWVAVLLKTLGGLLALALIRPWGSRLPRRLVLVVGAGAAALLTIYGGAQVVAGTLVETGALHPSGSVDWRALRWHLGLWDLWFLVWGILLTVAVWPFDRGAGESLHPRR